MSPEFAQCTVNRRAILTRFDGHPRLGIEVATVDSFQGKEADICIYSVTLNNSSDYLGFLKSAKRLNVALSRPRDLLLIIGDQEFCYRVSGENPFTRIIDSRSQLRYLRDSECS